MVPLPTNDELTADEIRFLLQIIAFVKLIGNQSGIGGCALKSSTVVFTQDIDRIVEKLTKMIPSSSGTNMIKITKDLKNTEMKEFKHSQLYEKVPIELPQEDTAQRGYYKEIDSFSRILRASWHQGHRIFSDSSAGKQCCSMALANILRAHILPPKQWRTSVLDSNMTEGDYIYRKVMELIDPSELHGSEFLLVRNFHVISNDFTAFSVSFKIVHENDSSWFGSLIDDFNDEVNMHSFRRALATLFVSHKAGILIAHEKAYGVMKFDQKYYFTDSHSCGPMDEEYLKLTGGGGKACIIECDILNELVLACKRATAPERGQYTLDYVDVHITV